MWRGGRWLASPSVNLRKLLAAHPFANLFWVLLASIVPVFIGVSHVNAAPSVTYKGITLTPAIINLDLVAGQTHAPFDVQVTNNTQVPQSLRLSSIDFKSLNQSGGLAFVGNGSSQITAQHSLASWLNLGNGAVDLTPGQSKTVHMLVDNRSDLAPGGHYAAVLFQSTKDTTGTSNNHVAINQVVSALIFVRKVDGATYGVDISTIAVPNNWFKQPNSVNVVLTDTGNTQEVPRGLVTATGPITGEIARGLVNPDSNLLLPDSSRLFQVPLQRTRHAWWPGFYKVTVSYRYDGTTQLQTATTSFLYISPFFIVVLLVILAIGYFLMRQRKALYRRIIKFRPIKRK